MGVWCWGSSGRGWDHPLAHVGGGKGVAIPAARPQPLAGLRPCLCRHPHTPPPFAHATTVPLTPHPTPAVMPQAGEGAAVIYYHGGVAEANASVRCTGCTLHKNDSPSCTAIQMSRTGGDPPFILDLRGSTFTSASLWGGGAGPPAQTKPIASRMRCPECARSMLNQTGLSRPVAACRACSVAVGPPRPSQQAAEPLPPCHAPSAPCQAALAPARAAAKALQSAAQRTTQTGSPW